MALRFMSSYSLCLPKSSLSFTKMDVGKWKRRRLNLHKREHLNICSRASSPLPAETQRRTANYEPSSWNYDLLQSLSATNSESYEFGEERARFTKEDIRRLLRDEAKPLCEIVLLIDNIQRLGLEHHFEEDTISALHRVAVLPILEFTDVNGTVSNLHFVALSFRLLREHGFQVSQDVFERFKGEDGLFKTKLIEDAEGMLSLYEASRLGYEGENVIHEAKAFTRRNLTHILNLSTVVKPLARKINHALELPFHCQMRRLEARWNVESYNPQSNGANHAILQLGKYDFNSVQSVHREELQDLTRWWKDLGLLNKLSFARDRLVECYFWSVGMASEPQYKECRKALTKVASFITVLDDVYDVYGTMEELELFTCAVERWDVSMVNDMPDYMKLCFLAFYNTINEIAYDILEERGISAISYLAKAWADLLHAFMKEAKWSLARHTPNLQEYLNNGWLSSSGPLLLVHAYFFMSNYNMDTEELENLQNYHALLRLPSLIFRLCNDSSTFKAEMEKGDVAKAIQCYMKDTGGGEEEAREHIANLIEETWKKLNKEAASNSSSSSSFSKAFIKTAIDLARISQAHYQYGDGHGAPDSRSKNRVSSLFIQPISIDL